MSEVTKSSSAAIAELKKERSFVSTTSLTLWRVRTRLLASVELPNAGSGLTEETTNLNAFLAIEWMLGSLHREKKASH